MQLHFLHGTETGTSEILCEDLEAAMPDTTTCKVSSVEDLQPGDLNADEFYVFVVSTYGSGDVPSSAWSFHEKLKKTQPDLGHVRFAVFGLGDSTFSTTYNQGSEQVMNQLLACGATMVGERGLFDASTGDMPEDIAEPWMQGILQQLAAQAA